MATLFTNNLTPDNLDDAQKIIRENLNSFLIMFHSNPSCMSITTNDRTYIEVNERFQKIYGFEKEEIIGKNAREVGILDPDEHERVSTLMKENGRIKNEVIKCNTKSGDVIYAISCIEKTVFNGETYWVSSFLDITPLRQQQLIIEQQNREIMESIQYARLIQQAVFPTENYLKSLIPDSFVLIKPKSILTGDFYWVKEKEGKLFVAACDCTGHGVPGALISIIANKLLNTFVVEYGIIDPAEILNQLNLKIQNADKTLETKSQELKDGLDIALCVIDRANMKMEYAGAYNPVYRVRNNQLEQLSTDKIPIHLFSDDEGPRFVNYKLNIKPGDSYYLFSDGYADQFGGPMGKKFRYKNFQELILSNSNLSMDEQKQIYNATIEKWKSESPDQEQTDDILILGFKIH